MVARLKGKIFLYNVDLGNGLILSQSKEKFKFEMDVWEDFENLPEMGLVVTFDVEDGEISNIQKCKEEELKKAKEEKEEDLDIKNLSAKNVEPGLLDKRLDIFFKDIQELEEDEIELDDTENTLDYFRMKRFMFTAFNNLIELDASIYDQNVSTLYEQINEAQSQYDKYKKTYLYPKLAFNNIFLKYTNHQKAQRRLELNLSEMGDLKATLEPLEEKIKAKVKKLSSLDKKSEECEDLALSIKKDRRVYVDTIDKIGTIREENELLIPIIEEYYDLFYEEFVDKFDLTCRESLNFLQERLNALAFVFDKFMWAKARKSKIVQNFFKESGIHEDYSSLTYLKYYLKALDSEKLSNDHKELFELKEYLERKQLNQSKGA